MEKYGLKKALKLSAIAVCALSLSACVSNPNQLGFGLAGSALGGLGGSQIGKGKGKLIATGVGALLGAFGGSQFGNRLDQVGRNHTAIGHNSNSIMNLSHQQRSAPTAVPAPVIYQSPQQQMYQQHSVPLRCRIVSNYVRCDGA